MNVATWHAFQEGILPVFAAGNSGTDTNTLNPYALAPYVLGAAATNDAMEIVDFFSRGRPPDYDGTNNWDRTKALRNIEAYHEADKTDTVVAEGSYSGTVGPSSSQFHRWETPKEAGYVEATLSWTPSTEDVDFYLPRGSIDGEMVGTGASLNHPEEIAVAIDGGETYYFEVRPFANVAADYDIATSRRDTTPRSRVTTSRNSTAGSGSRTTRSTTSR